MSDREMAANSKSQHDIWFLNLKNRFQGEVKNDVDDISNQCAIFPIIQREYWQ